MPSLCCAHFDGAVWEGGREGGGREREGGGERGREGGWEGGREDERDRKLMYTHVGGGSDRE